MIRDPVDAVEVTDKPSSREHSNPTSCTVVSEKACDLTEMHMVHDNNILFDYGLKFYTPPYPYQQESKAKEKIKLLNMFVSEAVLVHNLAGQVYDTKRCYQLLRFER